jgi:hypothetical protein
VPSLRTNGVLSPLHHGVELKAQTQLHLDYVNLFGGKINIVKKNTEDLLKASKEVSLDSRSTCRDYVDLRAHVSLPE